MSLEEFLDVQVSNIQSVVFDEFPSGFDRVAHEDREDFISFNRVVDPDFQ